MGMLRIAGWGQEQRQRGQQEGGAELASDSRYPMDLWLMPHTQPCITCVTLDLDLVSIAEWYLQEYPSLEVVLQWSTAAGHHYIPSMLRNKQTEPDG